MERLHIVDLLSFKSVSAILSLMLFSLSCMDDGQILVKELHVVKQVDCYPDSTYFNDLRQLQYDGEHYYMLDMTRKNVVRLSEDLTCMNDFGVYGRGPGELTAPYSFVASNDTVSILDYADMSLKQYSCDGFINSVDTGMNAGEGRICRTESGEYVLPLYSSKYQFAVVSGEEKRESGSIEQYAVPGKTMIMNSSNILAYGDKIIVVPHYLPYIKIYTMGSKEVSIVKLDDIPFYKDNMSHIKGQSDYRKNNVAYVLNHDISVSGNHLYILCPRYGTHYSIDRIVSLDLSSGKTDSVMQLPDSMYGSICVANGNVFAFNAGRSSLELLQEDILPNSAICQ